MTIRHALVIVPVAFLLACNPPSETPQNTAQSASPKSTETPLPKATVSFAQSTVGGRSIDAFSQGLTRRMTSLELGWSSSGSPGRLAIADVVTYGGNKPVITAPSGWTLLRDDSSPTTRQSLYWHVIEANDPSTQTWTFSEAVDAQGAILVLDNGVSTDPIDANAGSSANVSGQLVAKSVTTTSDGDLILAFYATNFAGPHEGPRDMKAIVDESRTPNTYWILATRQSQKGKTQDAICRTPQLFNWAAAQVAVKSTKGAAKTKPKN